MIITYFRSSSYTTWDFCPMSYFLQYVLGLYSKPNKKTEIGTVVHKGLEVLGCAKKALVEKKTSITDDAIGVVGVDSVLFSDTFVDYVVDKSFDYYTSKSPNSFSEDDREECKALTHKVTDGMFDPRKLDIVNPEAAFDIPIDAPWAHYDYTLPNGERMEGQLSIKGTIDLCVRSSDFLIELIDWKSGRFWDWGKNCAKTFDSLNNDPQMLIYFWAIHHIYHKVAKQFMITIYYIRNEGPITLSLTDNKLIQCEEMIRKRFELIKDTRTPRCNKTWKCKSFCHFGKTPHPNGNGETICQYIEAKLAKKGAAVVMAEDTCPGHTIGKYAAPGA